MYWPRQLDFTIVLPEPPSLMFATAFVRFYRFFHGRLHLRGAGALIRFAARWLPSLQAYPYQLPEVGTVIMDFRDASSCGMVNVSMGELGSAGFMLKLLTRCTKPGDVVWDVGANLGWVSSYMAHPRFGLASIQAFEPNPTAYRPLQSLFAQHSLVKVHPFGLANANTKAELSIDPESTQVSSLRHKVSPRHTVPVQLRRGDDVQRELGLPLPNAIKIDVEGFEPEVMNGLRETIARSRPVILLEYQFLTDEEIHQMVPTGYDILLMLDDDTLTSDFKKRSLGHDAVLFPKENAAWLEGVPRA